MSFSAAQRHYTMGKGQKTLDVPSTWTGPNGLTITKHYLFTQGKYDVQVRYNIDNQGSTAWQGQMYGQLTRSSQGRFHSMLSSYTTYVGAVVSTQKESYQKVKFKNMTSEPFNADSHGGWAAMVEHYFLGAWVPSSAANNHFYSQVYNNQYYSIGFAGPMIHINPGQSQQVSASLYLGPAIASLLKPIAPHLDLTVDYGFLWMLSKFLFFILNQFYIWFGNWGWSIILLTILINLVFSPLNAASYRSMAKMRRFSPKFQALKERYGDDKVQLNKAMMELYSKEKINPLGGCLPILIQMPIFLAYYYMLIASVELRQAPFMGWITDLSVKDPYHVLPVLMAFTMFLTQLLSPPLPDKTQRWMMRLLPVGMLALFWNFSAGLVLYWVSNNTIRFLQQAYIMFRMGDLKLPGVKKKPKTKPA